MRDKADKLMSHHKVVTYEIKGRTDYYKTGLLSSLVKLLSSRSASKLLKFRIMEVDSGLIRIVRYLLPTHYSINNLSQYITNTITITKDCIIDENGMDSGKIIFVNPSELNDFLSQIIPKCMNRDVYRDLLIPEWINSID